MSVQIPIDPSEAVPVFVIMGLSWIGLSRVGISLSCTCFLLACLLACLHNKGYLFCHGGVVDQ